VALKRVSFRAVKTAEAVPGGIPLQVLLPRETKVPAKAVGSLPFVELRVMRQLSMRSTRFGARPAANKRPHASGVAGADTGDQRHVHRAAVVGVVTQAGHEDLGRCLGAPTRRRRERERQLTTITLKGAIVFIVFVPGSAPPFRETANPTCAKGVGEGVAAAVVFERIVATRGDNTRAAIRSETRQVADDFAVVHANDGVGAIGADTVVVVGDHGIGHAGIAPATVETLGANPGIRASLHPAAVDDRGRDIAGAIDFREDAELTIPHCRVVNKELHVARPLMVSGP
jgi:hypothetical protein